MRVAPMLAMVPDWRGLLDSAIPEEELQELREHGRTGRTGRTGHPLGSTPFVDRLEQAAGRVLRPKKSGRPPKLRKRP